MSQYFITPSVILCVFLLFCCSSKEGKTQNVCNQDSTRMEYILEKSLSLDGYAPYTGDLPKDGFVSTPDIAVQIAEAVLSGIYGNKNIEKQKPFFVNIENGIWIIVGQLKEYHRGGTAYIEIRKSNGEILKVTHGK